VGRRRADERPTGPAAARAATAGGEAGRSADAGQIDGAAARIWEMGGLGLLLANAFLAALFWLLTDWGWLPTDSVAPISWIGLVSVAAILAVGMSWSRLRRLRRSRAA